MARGPENTFIASVHRKIPKGKPYWMKNHNAYIGGPADVWYSGNEGDVWVEYKYTHRLPPIINLLDRKKKYCLSALQEEWLNDRYAEGRRVFVILGFEYGGVIFRDREWNRPHPASSLSQYTRQDIAKWIINETMGLYDVPSKPRKGLERCI